MKLTKQSEPETTAKFLYETDDIDHINIHFHVGKSELGKLLSHFARTPFVHPQYGKFNSLEAFWWWIRAVSPNDLIRSYNGDKARSFGKDWPKRQSQDFFKQIYIANYYRIKQNGALRRLLKASTLPFTYYYIFKGVDGPQQIDDRYSAQLIPMFEDLRRLFKEGKELDVDNIPQYTIR